MSELRGYSASQLRGFAASQLRARGTGIQIFPVDFTEDMEWRISATVKHFRTVNGIKDPTPTDDLTFTGISVNFQFFKVYGAMFGISTHEYEAIRLGGYNGTIDTQNDTLDPTKHPGFTRWDPFSAGSPPFFEQGFAWTAEDHPQGSGIGMGIDASFVRFIGLPDIDNLDGAVTSSPTGFLTHAAELASGSGPIKDFDIWRIIVYYPNPGLSSFFSGDSGAPDFHDVRSRLEFEFRYELVG